MTRAEMEQARKRNLKIVELRSNGLSLAEIGKLYGFDREKVKGILYRCRRKERDEQAIRENHGDWIANFSGPVKIALIRSGIYTPKDLHNAVESKSPVWRIGEKAISEINATIDRKIKRVYKSIVKYSKKHKHSVYTGEESYLEYVGD